jgi:alpha-ribazole phosphatase
MNLELRWWWIRHAPSAGAPGIVHGCDDVDADLSDTVALSRLTDSLPTTEHWYVSNLNRARKTANAICNGIIPEVAPEFNEQSYGDWEGLTWDEVPEAEQRQFWKNTALGSAPNGESYTELFNRVYGKIVEISAEIPDGDIVIVSHDGPIRVALNMAMSDDIGPPMAFELDNLSRTCIVMTTGENGTNWSIRGVNV